MRLPNWTLPAKSSLLPAKSTLHALLQPCAFSLATVSIFSAKLLRLYAHRAAIASPLLIFWLPSVFFQDTLAVLILRYIQHAGRFGPGLVTCAAWILCFMSTIDISFFFTSGSELQWRNISVAEDPASWNMLASGLAASTLVFLGLVALSIVLRIPCSTVVDAILDCSSFIGSVVVAVVKTAYQKTPVKPGGYESLPAADLEGATEAASLISPEEETRTFRQKLRKVAGKLLVGMVCLAIPALCTLLRPRNATSIFVSWTLPLQPIQFLLNISFNWAGYGGPGAIALNVTALTAPRNITGLPDEDMPGFGDWFQGSDHYDVVQDPLKISNLQDDMIEELWNLGLDDYPVQHVILLTLESTRKDVFPIKKDGIIWDKFASEFEDGQIPESVHNHLASLTPFARGLTGDLEDGFDHSDQTNLPSYVNRGGLNVNSAFTTSSYTLKSLTGTHCGITPVAADFDVEQDHHIYQPCLPHILDMLNKVECESKQKGSEAPGNWSSVYMQSTTLGYDGQDNLMPKLGFSPDNIIGAEYLHSSNHKFEASHLDDVNYYGMPEVALEDYLRDKFVTAKEKNERVFLSHLTSSTHDPFGIPKSRTALDLGPENLVTRYLHAVHYDDWWLGRIMEILEAEGVLNQTLIVAVGDHGLSVVEHGSITPYENPHVANLHVPLVFSHPTLPRTIDINDPVSSIQILPTILDILIETKSLSPCQIATARDLLANYEGQSLLRPLKPSFTPLNGTEVGNWQFTVTNPGGSVLSIRDARHPDWRLVVPLIANEEWWFSNFTRDPHDMLPIRSFDRGVLLDKVDVQGGEGAVAWIREAVEVTRWWFVENRRRWQYGESPRRG